MPLPEPPPIPVPPSYPSVADLRALLQSFKNDDLSTLSSIQYVLAVLLDYTYSLPVSGGISELTGDVTAGPGTGSQVATVTGLDGNPVSAGSPALGDALIWDGTQWTPQAGGTSGVTDVTASAPLASSGGSTPDIFLTAGTSVGDVIAWDGSAWVVSAPAVTGITELGGDVIAGPGTGLQNATVAGIEGIPVDATAPTPGQVLGYNGVWWTPTTLPADTGITELTGDVTAGPGSGSQASTVTALQGNPVSTVLPDDGQVLTWNGSAWVPGAPATGGSGGGGQTYFLNAGTLGDGDVSGLPGSPLELGLTAETSTTPVTALSLPTGGTYALVAGFVTDAGFPGLTAIPAGVWDFNVWAQSSAPQPNTTSFRLKVYSYDDTIPSAPVLISTGEATPLYDPSQMIQYVSSILIPQTAITTADRIYVEIEATAKSSGHSITVNFGGSTPTHTHTTLPSIAGTGVVHVINGVVQSPASPVDLTAGASEISGTLPVGNGGTGLSTPPSDGQLLIGQTATQDYALATLTAGSNVSITSGAGSITIDAAGSISGTIAANEVAFGTAPDTIGGSASLTFNSTTQDLTVGDGSPHSIRIGPYGYVSNPIIESQDSMNINIANFSGALGIQAANNDLVLIGGDDGGGQSYLQTQPNVRLETQGRLLVKPATDGADGLEVRNAANDLLVQVDTASKTTTLTGDANPVLVLVDEIAAAPFFTIYPVTRELAIFEPLSPSDVAIVSPTDVSVTNSVTAQTGNVSGGLVSVADSGTGNTLELRIPGGVATLASEDGALNPFPLNLVIEELQVNGAPGNIGEVLTSNGPNAAPTWQPGGGGGGGGVDISFRGENTGTSPLVIGAVYLPATTFSTALSVLLGVVGAGTATLRLIEQSTSTVVATWTQTGAITDVTISPPLTVSAGWHVFELYGSAGGTIVRCYGAHFE